MCGILGFHSQADEQIRRQLLEGFCEGLEETMSRGKDATGIAFFDEDAIQFCKAPLPADQFLKQSKVQTFMRKHIPSVMIGHCRQGTVGTELDNHNNHPILYSVDGITTTALIHNGSITNHNAFQKLQANREGTVDSEVIILLIRDALTGQEVTIPHVLEAIKTMTIDTYGSQACALILKELPHTLFLWRRSSPLVLGYFKEWNTIIFASTNKILHTMVEQHMEIIEGIPVIPSGFGSTELEEGEMMAITINKNDMNIVREKMTAFGGIVKDFRSSREKNTQLGFGYDY